MVSESSYVDKEKSLRLMVLDLAEASTKAYEEARKEIVVAYSCLRPFMCACSCSCISEVSLSGSYP